MKLALASASSSQLVTFGAAELLFTRSPWVLPAVKTERIPFWWTRRLSLNGSFEGSRAAPPTAGTGGKRGEVAGGVGGYTHTRNWGGRVVMPPEGGA